MLKHFGVGFGFRGRAMNRKRLDHNGLPNLDGLGWAVVTRELDKDGYEPMYSHPTTVAAMEMRAQCKCLVVASALCAWIAFSLLTPVETSYYGTGKALAILVGGLAVMLTPWRQTKLPACFAVLGIILCFPAWHLSQSTWRWMNCGALLSFALAGVGFAIRGSMEGKDDYVRISHDNVMHVDALIPRTTVPIWRGLSCGLIGFGIGVVLIWSNYRLYIEE